MGHGILSDTPFHVIGGWTTDMSVNYSEVNRWERENEKKKNPWPDPLDPTIQAQKRKKQKIYRKRALLRKQLPDMLGIWIYHDELGKGQIISLLPDGFTADFYGKRINITVAAAIGHIKPLDECTKEERGRIWGIENPPNRLKRSMLSPKKKQTAKVSPRPKKVTKNSNKQNGQKKITKAAGTVPKNPAASKADLSKLLEWGKKHNL